MSRVYPPQNRNESTNSNIPPVSRFRDENVSDRNKPDMTKPTTFQKLSIALASGGLSATTWFAIITVLPVAVAVPVTLPAIAGSILFLCTLYDLVNGSGKIGGGGNNSYTHIFVKQKDGTTELIELDEASKSIIENYMDTKPCLEVNIKKDEKGNLTIEKSNNEIMQHDQPVCFVNPNNIDAKKVLEIILQQYENKWVRIRKVNVGTPITLDKMEGNQLDGLKDMIVSKNQQGILSSVFENSYQQRITGEEISEKDWLEEKANNAEIVYEELPESLKDSFKIYENNFKSINRLNYEYVIIPPIKENTEGGRKQTKHKRKSKTKQKYKSKKQSKTKKQSKSKKQSKGRKQK